MAEDTRCWDLNVTCLSDGGYSVLGKHCRPCTVLAVVQSAGTGGNGVDRCRGNGNNLTSSFKMVTINFWAKCDGY